MRRATAALLAVGMAAVVCAPSAQAATKMGAHPALFPAFDTKVSDYVSRCHSGRQLRLKIHAPSSQRVTVGGRKAQAGSTKARLSLTGGQGVSVTIASGHK